MLTKLNRKVNLMDEENGDYVALKQHHESVSTKVHDGARFNVSNPI